MYPRYIPDPKIFGCRIRYISGIHRGSRESEGYRDTRICFSPPPLGKNPCFKYVKNILTKQLITSFISFYFFSWHQQIATTFLIHTILLTNTKVLISFIERFFVEREIAENFRRHSISSTKHVVKNKSSKS